MSISFDEYYVKFESFTERHYIKSFSKKYKSSWVETESSIVSFLSRIDTVLGNTTRAEIVHAKGCKKIIKLDFKIAGSNESAKTSGNRAVVFVDDNQKECRVLLVYSKNDISSPNETQKWQAIIKENYNDIWSIFS